MTKKIWFKLGLPNTKDRKMDVQTDRETYVQWIYNDLSSTSIVRTHKLTLTIIIV